jgi:two-component system response regulator RegA
MSSPVDSPKQPTSGERAPFRPTILLVDDDLVLLEALRRRLLRLGCSVWTASNVAFALALTVSSRFDVVLTDLRIGEESGLALLRTIQRAGGDTGLVLMSGDAREAERQEARALGVRDVLAKPFDRVDLEAALARALGDKPLPGR